VRLKEIFPVLIIFSLLTACSSTKGMTRKTTPLSPRIIELNTGGSPSKVVKHRTSYNYEAVYSARTRQFVITEMPFVVRAPERAIKFRGERISHPPKLARNHGSGAMFHHAKNLSACHAQAGMKHVAPEITTLVIHFALNSWVVTPSEREKLNHFIREKHPREVDVTGYTCWLGSKKYNQWLALKRAKEVALCLKKAGIKTRSVTGKGKCCYIDRKTPAPNRRVEINVYQVKPVGEGNSREGR